MPKPSNAFLAGFLPGFFLLFMKEESRIAFAQYISVRALQCLYHAAVHKHSDSPTDAVKDVRPKSAVFFDEKGIKNFDAILFSVSTGFILYGYILRPNTLDPTYYAFLQSLGRVHPATFEAISLFLRHREAYNPSELADKLLHHRPFNQNLRDILVNTKDILVPCNALHPHQESCFKYDIQVGLRGLKLAFPMYFSLHALTTILFRWSSPVIKWPAIVQSILVNTCQSSLFLTMLCFSIHAASCSYRSFLTHPPPPLHLSLRDQKLFYWLIGAVPAFACIFIEKKQRRIELALYVRRQPPCLTPKSIHMSVGLAESCHHCL
jgi:hypothetical protein